MGHLQQNGVECTYAVEAGRRVGGWRMEEAGIEKEIGKYSRVFQHLDFDYFLK